MLNIVIEIHKKHYKKLNMIITNKIFGDTSVL